MPLELLGLSALVVLVLVVLYLTECLTSTLRTLYEQERAPIRTTPPPVGHLRAQYVRSQKGA